MPATAAAMSQMTTDRPRRNTGSANCTIGIAVDAGVERVWSALMACLPSWCVMPLGRVQCDRDRLVSIRERVLLAVQQVGAPVAQLAGEVGEVLRADQVRRRRGGAAADAGVQRVELPAKKPPVNRAELPAEPLPLGQLAAVFVDLEAKHRGGDRRAQPRDLAGR